MDKYINLVQSIIMEFRFDINFRINYRNNHLGELKADGRLESYDNKTAALSAAVIGLDQALGSMHDYNNA